MVSPRLLWPSAGRERAAQPEGQAGQAEQHRARRPQQQTSDAASASDASSPQQQQQQQPTQTQATTAAQTAPAQVLTRSALPSLSTLDAGDVIECYALFRRAELTPTEPAPIASGGSSGGDGRMVDEDAESGSGSNGSNGKAKQPHSAGGPRGEHSSSLVRIQKSALAFRYRPPSWSALDQDADIPADSGYARKRTYELTLEYGPSRRGSGLDQEAIPVVVGGLDGGVTYPGDGYAHVTTTTTTTNGDGNADPGYGHDDADGGDGGQPPQQQPTSEALYPDERYVTWDNAAKIYYRTDIAAEEWVEAYYVAPISGAVLGKVLDYAVEYAERHRRYQPFEVVAIGGDEDEDGDEEEDGESDGDNSNCDFGSSCERKNSGPSPDHPRTILRSSSADDFVWSVFDALASMYVDIRPILAPPRERVRFLVRDGRDVTRLSGLVRGEDLALPGVPIDAAAGDGSDGDGDGDGDADGSDNASSGHGGGREDEGEEGSAAQPAGGGPPPSRTVASLAADFYSRFYDCANAIRTGDYSRWEEREPAQTQTQTQRPPSAVEPTVAPDGTGDGTDGNSNSKKKNDNKTKKAALHDPAKDIDAAADDDAIVNGNDNDDGNDDDDDDGFEFDDGEEDEPPHRRFLKQGKKDKGNSTATAQIPTPTAKAAAVTATEPEPEPGLAEFEFQEAIAAKEEGDAGESDSTSADADNDEADDQQGSQEQIDEASAAEQAAIEALDKANDAAAAISSNADDDEAMAEAAQEAATAAKKAAEASSLAKAAAAMDALFSADGGQMTQILGTCLNDPKYEIRVDRKVALPSVNPDDDRQMEDGSASETTEHRYATVSTTHVYLYIDGTSYYRLNLTPPFWDASPAIQAMPQPKVYEEGRAQFLDSLFFFGIIGAFVFGMVVLLHNIGVLRIDPRLKFKSFFHPAHPGPAGGAKGGYMNATELRESGGYRDESEVDSDSCFTDEASDADLKDVPDEAQPTRGGGQAHPFHNPGAIPSIFMGKSASSQNLRVGDNAPADSWEGDLELSDMKGGDERQGDESRRSSSNRTGSDLDFDAEGGMRRTPIVRGRSKSFRRDDPNRSVHNTSSSSNRRRRSPVDTLPLPAQVRANRDPELVDLPGLKSLTPVAVPEGVMRQSSRASKSNGKRSLNGELQQEAADDIATENGAANGSTPLAIV